MDGEVCAFSCSTLLTASVQSLARLAGQKREGDPSERSDLFCQEVQHGGGALVLLARGRPDALIS